MQLKTNGRLRSELYTLDLVNGEYAKFLIDDLETCLAEIEKLRAVVDAARKLQNEVIGMYNIADFELREILGNTNVSVLVTRLDEMNKALSALDGETK